MDTLLLGGDHGTDSRGIPVTLKDARELIQRALIRLTVRKGSFALDPELGSELYKLCGIRRGELSRLAQSYVQEALLPIPEISVSGVSVEYVDPDAARLFVSLSIAETQYQLEVDIN